MRIINIKLDLNQLGYIGSLKEPVLNICPCLLNNVMALEMYDLFRRHLVSL